MQNLISTFKCQPGLNALALVVHVSSAARAPSINVCSLCTSIYVSGSRLTVNAAFGGCLAVAQGAAKRDSVTRVVQEARFHREAIDARELDSFDLEEEDPEDVDTDEVVLNP